MLVAETRAFIQYKGGGSQGSGISSSLKLYFVSEHTHSIFFAAVVVLMLHSQEEIPCMYIRRLPENIIYGTA